IDAADPATPSGSTFTSLTAPCLITDQRGQPRPIDGNGDTSPRCDIGAFEAPALTQADLAVSMIDTPDPVIAGLTLTYTVTVTNASTDPNTGNNSATTTTTVNAATPATVPCAPRPNVSVQVTPVAAGTLRVTITAQTSPTTPTNSLRELRVGAASNALIDVPG